MSIFTPGRRVVISHPDIIPAMQGRSGVVETPLTRDALVDTSRGEAAIIRMDDPLSLRFLMFYATECSPLDLPSHQQLNLI